MGNCEEEMMGSHCESNFRGRKCCYLNIILLAFLVMSLAFKSWIISPAQHPTSWLELDQTLFRLLPLKPIAAVLSSLSYFAQRLQIRLINYSSRKTTHLILSAKERGLRRHNAWHQIVILSPINMQCIQKRKFIFNTWSHTKISTPTLINPRRCNLPPSCKIQGILSRR